MKKNNKKEIYSIEELKKLQKEKIYKKYDLNLKKENFLSFSNETLKISKIFLSNFIEKIAIWYEFKYSNDDLKELFEYKNNIDNSNFNFFLEKLSSEEKELLGEVKYDLYNYIGGNIGQLNLDSNGIIVNMEIFYSDYRDYIGHHIKEFYNALKFYRKKDSLNVKQIIDKYENKIKFKEMLFDNIMYRIIERGGATYGVERAYLFALEFQRDINIPMIYYHNEESLRHSKNFIDNFLKNNGDKNTICCYGYFTKNIRELPLKEYIDWLELITLNMSDKKAKIIKLQRNDLK